MFSDCKTFSDRVWREILVEMELLLDFALGSFLFLSSSLHSPVTCGLRSSECKFNLLHYASMLFAAIAQCTTHIPYWTHWIIAARLPNRGVAVHDFQLLNVGRHFSHTSSLHRYLWLVLTRMSWCERRTENIHLRLNGCRFNRRWIEWHVVPDVCLVCEYDFNVMIWWQIQLHIQLS